MGILDWLKGGQGKAEEAVATTAKMEDRGAEVGGLNFKSAIDAHMRWKVRLETYINGTSNEDLKVDVVCRDDQCPLGKWIYGTGSSQFGYSETFFDMKAHHANFHRCAGDVLSHAQRGQKEAALGLLHHGEYVRASERVKTLLARLFVLVADGKAALDAHVKWKARLYDFVEGHSREQLEAAEVARDDTCALGLWINGVGGERYGHLLQFAHLRKLHAEFHNRAADVIALARQGRREEALHMLEEGAYAQASDDIVVALVEMFSAEPA